MHSCIQGAEAVCKVVVYGGIDRFFFCLFLNYFILAGGSVCSVSVLLKLDC